jgi:hypothetical protein
MLFTMEKLNVLYMSETCEYFTASKILCRCLLVCSFPDVQDQVHDHFYAKYHRFESIQEALVYMVLKGNLQRMKELQLFPESKQTFKNISITSTQLYSR